MPSDQLPRCANCKHWSDADLNAGKGRCHMLESFSGDHATLLLSVAPGGPLALVKGPELMSPGAVIEFRTRPDFGCTLGEERHAV